MNLLLSLLFAPPIRVLFIGNSHTAANNLPLMVQSLFPAGTLKAEHRSGAFLNDIAKNPEVIKTIREGHYNFVILQGAMLSSSHKYKYTQEGAIKLATEAAASGARVLLFAEWSRKGIRESDYILGIYGGISKQTKAKIVPICTAFDNAIVANKDLDLWSSDGNHASVQGSFLAALTIYRALEGTRPPTWKPAHVSTSLCKVLWNASQVTNTASKNHPG